MVILPHDTESKSRNADFIIIARRAIPQPSGRRPVKPTKLKNPQPPLVPTAPPFRPAGKRVTGFSVVYRLPTNPVPLPPQAVGRKRVYKCSPPTPRERGTMLPPNLPSPFMGKGDHASLKLACPIYGEGGPRQWWKGADAWRRAGSDSTYRKKFYVQVVKRGGLCNINV